MRISRAFFVVSSALAMSLTAGTVYWVGEAARPAARAATPTHTTGAVSERVVSLGSPQQPGDAVELLRAQPAQVPIAEPSGVTELAAPLATPAMRFVTKLTPGQRAIGLSWQADPSALITVAARYAVNGSWQPWAAQAGDSPRDGAPAQARAGTELFFADGSAADQLEVVLTSIQGPQPQDVRLHILKPGAVKTQAAPAIEPSPSQAPLPSQTPVPSTSSETPSPSATPQPTPVPELAYYSRAYWGADESQMTWPSEYADDVKAVVVHHTATRNEYTAEEVPAILQSIYYFQSVSREWGDIGYNLLVDKWGRAWEGRAGGVSEAVVGAHAGGFNTGTAGISLLGDFTSAEPTPEALETTARFIAYKLRKYNHDPREQFELTGGPSDKLPAGTTLTAPRVFGHNLTSATACPGGALEAKLDFLRNRAAEYSSVTLTAAG